jgi:hypothetical protein
MLTARLLSFTLKHRAKSMTTTTMVIIIITEMTKIGWWYNSLADCCLSLIPQRRCCFFFFFFFFLFFLYVYFSTGSNKKNSTRFSAIFVLLSVSPYIPTTSISILSPIYSLFYASLNYMCYVEREHLGFFFFSYQQDNTGNTSLFHIRNSNNTMIRKRTRKLRNEHDDSMTKGLSFLNRRLL